MVQKMSMTNNPKIDSLLLAPHATFNTSHYVQGSVDPYGVDP